MRTLEQLSPGESGVIQQVGNKSGQVKRRLVDMGLTPGTLVTVKKIAPFGDPMQISLRSYEMSLRKSDASQIIIGDTKAKRRSAKKSNIYYSPKQQIDTATMRHMIAAHEHELNDHSSNYDATAHDKREMKIALVGNPNSGKTTLFNALTGLNQYVGNWPGVTVEKKEGKTKILGRDITIVDLPGIYSLSPYSMEEIVARDFIIKDAPDVIINIVDATNIERNMYLTIQLLELEKPTIMALNFMDEAAKHGDRIDVGLLTKELGIPVVPITAKTGENLDELLHVAHRQIHMGFTIEPDDLYDDYTHAIHHKIGSLIHDRAYAVHLPAHWSAIKLLEGDSLVEEVMHLDEHTKNKVDVIAKEYENSSDLGDRETLIADSRYRYIERIVAKSVVKGKKFGDASISDKIDSIVTNKYLAIPAFLLTMLIMFIITFGTVGSFLSDQVAFLIDECFAPWISSLLSSVNVAPWLISLICDGIISGVGGVLTFLPQIALLFFFLSLLEDSGYMSRAAFIMDRLLRKFGLSGKAFIPMLMGFGCSVPAIMGARTMENEKDRRMTIMLIPFMSCSAKLPVYGLISAAFFGKYAGIVVFAMYILGMLIAILSGIIFKKTLFKGEPAAFVLELPPYRLPLFESTMRHVWEKVRGFLIKAGTLILVMSIALWFLETFNTSFNMVSDMSDSILGKIGGFIAPIFEPQGFGVWQAAVALLTGLVAKEAVVASLSMFYGFSLTASSSAVAAAMTGFTPLSALSYLVFILLYVPCVAAVATIRREMNSIKWTIISVIWQILCAYVISLLVFQVGSLFI